MKWIFPIKILSCTCVALIFIHTVICAPQGLSSYKYYDIDRYNYENHPAARRARYLYGNSPQSRLPQDQTTLSTHNNKYYNNYNGNAITDPYAKRQFSDYKGYDVNELQKYTSDNNAQKPVTNTINQADKENAKFVGAKNQEADESDNGLGRGLAHFKLKRLKRLLRNRCLPFGRDSDGSDAKSDVSAQDQNGRFLWDINVYNLYPAPPVIAPGHGGGGCGGLLGGFLGGGGPGFGGVGGPGGGGIFSDPVPPVSPLNNFLNMFAPGILQNALAATAPPPPPPQSDQQYQSDPNVNPAYQQPSPQQQYAQPQQPQVYQPQRPNRVYYDSPGAPPITPAQLVGGVATTVNGIIQQLTGNVQPVYQQPYG